MDLLTFNANCPYHRRKCKCSKRGAPLLSHRIAGFSTRIQDKSHPVQLPTKGTHRSKTSPLTKTIITIHPSNATDTRIGNLVSCIERLGLHATPIVYLPSRLGQTSLLDHAADALINVAQASRPTASSTPRTQVRHQYALSLSTVHRALSTWFPENPVDDLLGAAAILGVVDVILHDPSRSHSQACFEFFTHWNGISSLLVLGGARAASSEVARASMALAGCSTFAIPCFQGTSSPFEVGHWFAAQPPALYASTAQLETLNRVAHRLFVKLPRLIKGLREVKEGNGGEKLREEVISLANELVVLKDDDAERWLLDRTTVVQTPGRDPFLQMEEDDGDDTANSPLAIANPLRFRKLEHLTAAVLYWQARILAMETHAEAHRLHEEYEYGASVPSSSSSSSSSSLSSSSIKPSDLQSQASTSIALLILRSFPLAADDFGVCATASHTIGLTTAWLAFRNSPAFSCSLRSSLLDYVLRELQTSYAGMAIGGTRENLDAACDVMIGGPLRGHLADIVRPLGRAGGCESVWKEGLECC